jgi:hypothetical protein
MSSHRFVLVASMILGACASLGDTWASEVPHGATSNEVSRRSPVSVGTYAKTVDPNWKYLEVGTSVPKKQADKKNGDRMTWSKLYSRAKYTRWRLSATDSRRDVRGYTKKVYAGVLPATAVGRRVYASIGGGFAGGSGGKDGVGGAGGQRRPDWYSLAIDIDVDVDSDRSGAIESDNLSAKAIEEDKCEFDKANVLGAIVGLDSRADLVVRKLMAAPATGGKNAQQLLEGMLLIQALNTSEGEIEIYLPGTDVLALETWPKSAPNPARYKLKDTLFSKLLKGEDLPLELRGKYAGKVDLVVMLQVRAKGSKDSYKEFRDYVRVTVDENLVDLDVPDPYFVFGPPYYPPVQTTTPDATPGAAGATPAAAPQAEPKPKPDPKPKPQPFRIKTLFNKVDKGKLAALRKVRLTIKITDVEGGGTREYEVKGTFEVNRTYGPTEVPHFQIETSGGKFVKNRNVVQIVVWDGKVTVTVDGKQEHRIPGDNAQLKATWEGLDARDNLIFAANRSSKCVFGRLLTVTVDGKAAQDSAQVGLAVKLGAKLKEAAGSIDFSKEYYFVVYKVEKGEIDYSSGSGQIAGKKESSTEFRASWMPAGPGEYVVLSEAYVKRTLRGVGLALAVPLGMPTIKVSGKPLTIRMTLRMIAKGSTTYKSPTAGGPTVKANYGPVNVCVDPFSKMKLAGAPEALRHLPERSVIEIQVYEINPDKTLSRADKYDGTVVVSEFRNKKDPLIFTGGLNSSLSEGKSVEVKGGKASVYVWSVAPYVFKDERPDIKVAFLGKEAPEDEKVDWIPLWVDYIGLVGPRGNRDPRGKITVLKAGDKYVGNKVFDWIDVQIWDIYERAKAPGLGELRRALTKVSVYNKVRSGLSSADGIKAKMYVRIDRTAMSAVNICPGVDGFRPKKNFTPFFEGRWFKRAGLPELKGTYDPFVHSFCHESRHAYQNFLLSDPKNDEDKDWLPAGAKGAATPQFGYPGPGDAKRTVLDDNDKPGNAMKYDPKTPRSIEGKDIQRTVGMVFVKVVGSSGSFVVVQYSLPAASAHDLPVVGEPVIEAEVGVAYRRITKKSYEKLGCAIAAIAANGDLGIKYNKDKFKGSPKIRMTYKYPCKQDPQSILELDAYTWTMVNEKKLEKDD